MPLISSQRLTVLAGAVGSGLLWGWSYIFYLASQSKMATAVTDWSDIAHAVASLAAIALLWPIVSRRKSGSMEVLADVGCAALVLGVVVSLFFSVLPDGADMRYIVVGKLLAGFGQTVFWVAWLSLLSRCEVGGVEASVLSWFPVGACLTAAVLLCGFAGKMEFFVLFTVLQCGIPLASLALFKCTASSLRRDGEVDGRARQERRSALHVDGGEVGGIAGVGLVLALSVFSWSVFLNERAYQLQDSAGLFVPALALAVVPTWAALRFTRCFGPSTLLCWVLPLFSAAVVADHVVGASNPTIPFLCFAAVNSGLDAFFKLFIVHMGWRLPGGEDIAVLVGMAVFTVAMAGGSCAWTCIVASGLAVPAPDALLVLLFGVCLASSVFLGREGAGARRARQETPEVVADSPTCCLSRFFSLSARETEVLAMLLAGKSRAYIREELCISKGTVDTHVNHIYRKTGVNSRDELMRFAEQFDARQSGQQAQSTKNR